VDTGGIACVDLQRDIQRLLGMKDHLSLDRVSTIIGFSFSKARIRSMHFSYRVPPPLRHFIKPHRALGDAARIFLLSRELAEAGETFKARARAHLAHPAVSGPGMRLRPDTLQARQVTAPPTEVRGS